MPDAARGAADPAAIERSIAALRQAAATLSQTDDLATLFDMLGDQVMVVVPYHTLRLFLLDADTEELYPVAIRTTVEDADLGSLDDPRFRLPLGKGVTGSIAARGVAEVIYDLEAHPEAFHIPGTPRVEESMIGLPLVYRDRTVGVLTLSKHGLAQFSEHQRTLMEVLAVSITAAIEHRRAIEAEQRALSQEQRLSQLHTTFIANISHELRTPLTTIKGFIELARARSDDGMSAILDGAQRGAERLAALVEDLLEVVTIEAGRQRLNPEPNDVATIVDAAIEAAALPRERLDVVGLDEPVSVVVDGPRFTNVLAELLENADKYGPAGGRIRIEVEQRPSDDVIRVVDEGPGIPLEHRGDIFHKFTQIDPTATRARGGTGVGLALARSLVQWHGGDLRYADQAPNTTFEVLLPRTPLTPPGA